jgi:glycosyltransferase involved in cell wall biosynthesis
MTLGKTRNRQLALSSGDFIAFLDHDDIWLSTKLEKQIPLFENQPKVGLVYCDTIFFNDKGDVKRLYNNRVPPRENVFKQILKNYFLAMPSVVIRKKTLDSQQQWFDDNFSMSEECDLFTRIALIMSMSH